MELSLEVLVAIGVGVLSLCFIIVLYGRTKAAVRTARHFVFLWLMSGEGIVLEGVSRWGKVRPDRPAARRSIPDDGGTSVLSRRALANRRRGGRGSGCQRMRPRPNAWQRRCVRRAASAP